MLLKRCTNPRVLVAIGLIGICLSILARGYPLPAVLTSDFVRGGWLGFCIGLELLGLFLLRKQKFAVRRPSPQAGLTGKTMTPRAAIITGASSGIGRALAPILAASGCAVGLIARRRDRLDEVAAAIRSAGGIADVAVADVGDRDALRSAIAAIEGRIGPTDVMVANAGYGAPTHLNPLNIAEVEATFRINLMGVVYSIEAVLPGMIARRSGQLVAISSLGAFKGMPGESAYCASKAAVNVYMEGLRIDLRGEGVKVATICPGFVTTEMTPMDTSTPFLMTADAAARRIARVIHRRQGGLVCFPRRMAAAMTVLRRLPDGLVARFFRHEPATPE